MTMILCQGPDLAIEVARYISRAAPTEIKLHAASILSYTSYATCIATNLRSEVGHQTPFSLLKSGVEIWKREPTQSTIYVYPLYTILPPHVDTGQYNIKFYYLARTHNYYIYNEKYFSERQFSYIVRVIT